MVDESSARPLTKQALVAKMLCRDTGSTIVDLVAATGWQAKTVHAALATLRKRGLHIAVEKVPGGNRYKMHEDF